MVKTNALHLHYSNCLPNQRNIDWCHAATANQQWRWSNEVRNGEPFCDFVMHVVPMFRIHHQCSAITNLHLWLLERKRMQSAPVSTKMMQSELFVVLVIILLSRHSSVFDTGVPRKWPPSRICLTTGEKLCLAVDLCHWQMVPIWGWLLWEQV